MLTPFLVAAALAQTPVELGGLPLTTLPDPPLAVVSENANLAYLLAADHTLSAWEQVDGAWVQRWARPEPDAAGLFVAGGRVWIERHQVRAEPVDGAAAPWSGATGGGVAETPAAATTEVRGEGTVTRAARGEAVVDLGHADGLSVGADLRFLRREELPSLSGEGTRTAERLVGSGRVTAVEDDSALVALTRSSEVAAGDVAEPHPGAAGYPLAPERVGGLVEAGLVLRPLLALDTLGVAFVNELWGNLAFEKPWYVEARLSPAGLGWSQDGNPLSMAAVAAGGLDQRWFSVGLGVGWSMLNSDVSVTGRSTDYALDDGGGGIGESTDFEDVKGAFSLAQQARLGARDGVNIAVRNTFVLVPEYTYSYDDCYETEWESGCETREQTGDAFTFGGIAMRGTVPVGNETDLFVDWGTGRAGATWITGGVATWVRGNGGSGSVGLEVAAGYGQVAGDPGDEYVALYGPLVSAGVRWRGAMGQ